MSGNESRSGQRQAVDGPAGPALPGDDAASAVDPSRHSSRTLHHPKLSISPVKAAADENVRSSATPPSPTAEEVSPGPWRLAASLIGAMLALFTSGQCLLWSVYATQLSAKFGYTSTQSNMIVAFSMTAMNIGGLVFGKLTDSVA
ncbi:hypothetical protein M427DRAFT_73150, partial [Gonapodya prolifera JEL478]